MDVRWPQMKDRTGQIVILGLVRVHRKGHHRFEEDGVDIGSTSVERLELIRNEVSLMKEEEEDCAVDASFSLLRLLHESLTAVSTCLKESRQCSIQQQLYAYPYENMKSI